MGLHLCRRCEPSALERLTANGYSNFLTTPTSGTNTIADARFTGCYGDSHSNNNVSQVTLGSGESMSFAQDDFVDSWTGGNTHAPCMTITGGHFNDFSGCYFDTSTQAVSITGGGSYHFVNCWFPATGGAGVTISGGNGFKFSSCMFDADYSDGLDITSGSNHLVQGCEFVADGQSGTPCAAIHVGASCTGAEIIGNWSGNNYSERSGFNGTGNYAEGLLVDAGASNVIATSNDFSNAGGLTNNSTASSILLANNIAPLNPFYQDGFVDTAGTALTSHTPTNVTTNAALTGQSYAAVTGQPANGTINPSGSLYVPVNCWAYDSNAAAESATTSKVVMTFTVLSRLSNGIGCFFRGLSSTVTCYNLTYQDNGTNAAIYLYKWVSASPTALINYTIPTVTVGHTYQVVLTSTGSSTLSFAGTIQDITAASPAVSIGTATDSSPLTGVYAGVDGGGNTATTSTTGMHLVSVQAYP